MGKTARMGISLLVADAASEPDFVYASADICCEASAPILPHARVTRPMTGRAISPLPLA